MLPSLPTIPWGRIAAFLLGLILIGVGLWMIKPVQNAVVSVVNVPEKIGKAAGKAAAAAGEAAA